MRSRAWASVRAPAAISSRKPLRTATLRSIAGVQAHAVVLHAQDDAVALARGAQREAALGALARGHAIHPRLQAVVQRVADQVQQRARAAPPPRRGRRGCPRRPPPAPLPCPARGPGRAPCAGRARRGPRAAACGCAAPLRPPARGPSAPRWPAAWPRGAARRPAPWPCSAAPRTPRPAGPRSSASRASWASSRASARRRTLASSRAARHLREVGGGAGEQIQAADFDADRAVRAHLRPRSAGPPCLALETAAGSLYGARRLAAAVAWRAPARERAAGGGDRRSSVGLGGRLRSRHRRALGGSWRRSLRGTAAQHRRLGDSAAELGLLDLGALPEPRHQLLHLGRVVGRHQAREHRHRVRGLEQRVGRAVGQHVAGRARWSERAPPSRGRAC